MLVIYRKGLRQIYSKSKRQFKIPEENVIRSIPAYDSVLGKRQDKAVQQVLSTKTSKRKRERRTSLFIVHKCAVPKLSSSSKLIAYISHISVNQKVWTVWLKMLFFRNIWPKLI